MELNLWLTSLSSLFTLMSIHYLYQLKSFLLELTAEEYLSCAFLLGYQGQVQRNPGSQPRIQHSQ